MEWDDLRHFLALARTGSVRSAGATLGVSHSTVARRVEALEERLSARLFDRNRDGYALTEAGRQMLPSAERVEEQMNELERGLLGKDERLAGAVAITCCDGFVSQIVLTELRDFLGAHPDIDLALIRDSRAFDLSKREADIAIRTLAKGTAPPDHLIGTKLAPVVIANYVARAHAERLDPEGGDAARWLATDQRRYMDILVAGSSYPEVPAWGSFSSIELLAQAAEAGLGIVMLPTYAGELTQSLQRLAHVDARHMADLWLVSHPDLRTNARFRAVREQVVAAFERRADLFRADGVG